MTAIILAGGKSSRLGFNKAFLNIKGTRLIEYLIERLRGLFKEVIIVTKTPYEYQGLKAKSVKDKFLLESPLVGIYSGLKEAKSPKSFVTACDMPFLNLDLIRYMKGALGDYDVIIPKVDNKLEPLCAIYSKNCIKPIKRQIEKNTLRITNFFKEVKVRYIQDEQIKKFDPELFSFLNVNTKRDFQQALEVLKNAGL